MAWSAYQFFMVDSYVVGPFKMTLLHYEHDDENRDYYAIIIAAHGTVWRTQNVRGDEAVARENFEQWKPVIAAEVAKIALRVGSMTP